MCLGLRGRNSDPRSRRRTPQTAWHRPADSWPTTPLLCLSLTWHALGGCAGKFKQVRLVTSEDVLRAEVPWPTFQSAGIITKEQLEMIYQLDKQSVETKLALFHKVSRRDALGLRGRELRCTVKR